MVSAPTLFDDFEATTPPPAPARKHSRAGDPSTAVAAGDAIRPALNTECTLVLGAVRGRGGSATAYEAMLELRAAGVDRPQNCVVRRMRDLADLGLLRDTGSTRPGRTNRQLIVWTIA